MNLMSVSGGDGVGLMMHPWALERSMGEVKANFPEHGQSLRLETVGKTVVEQSREEWERLDLPVDVLPWRGGGEGLRLGIRAVRADDLADVIRQHPAEAPSRRLGTERHVDHESLDRVLVGDRGRVLETRRRDEPNASLDVEFAEATVAGRVRRRQFFELRVVGFVLDRRRLRCVFQGRARRIALLSAADSSQNRDQDAHDDPARFGSHRFHLAMQPERDVRTGRAH